MVPVVLVTGGSGFIGTWVLRDLLMRGVRAVVVDTQPPPARWHRVLGARADDVLCTATPLLDPDGLRTLIGERQITHMIHLAALLTPACQQDPWIGCQVNVLGSVSVFEAARRSGRVRSLAYASSYAVYGPESDDRDPASHHPPSFYGAFKQSVDLIAEQYWRHFGIASVAVRPHVVYGPERDQGLTAGPSLAARAAALGERYTIGYTGRVSYDYVEDVARAFVRAALECPGQATVVDLPGCQATTQEFVRAIESAVPACAGQIGVEGPVIPENIPPHPHYISQIFPDWKTTPLLEGVGRTVDFYGAMRS